jgi:hypothetical protein
MHGKFTAVVWRAVIWYSRLRFRTVLPQKFTGACRHWLCNVNLDVNLVKLRATSLPDVGTIGIGYVLYHCRNSLIFLKKDLVRF